MRARPISKSRREARQSLKSKLEPVPGLQIMSCSLADSLLLPVNKAEAFRERKVESSDDELVNTGWVMRPFSSLGRNAVAANFVDVMRNPQTISRNESCCILAVLPAALRLRYVNLSRFRNVDDQITTHNYAGAGIRGEVDRRVLVACCS